MYDNRLATIKILKISIEEKDRNVSNDWIRTKRVIVLLESLLASMNDESSRLQHHHHRGSDDERWIRRATIIHRISSDNELLKYLSTNCRLDYCGSSILLGFH